MKLGAHRGEQTKTLDVPPREGQADGRLTVSDARSVPEIRFLIEFDHFGHHVGLVHLAFERLFGHGLLDLFLEVARAVDVHDRASARGGAETARKWNSEGRKEMGDQDRVEERRVRTDRFRYSSSVPRVSSRPFSPRLRALCASGKM